MIHLYHSNGLTRGGHKVLEKRENNEVEKSAEDKMLFGLVKTSKN